MGILAGFALLPLTIWFAEGAWLRSRFTAVQTGTAVKKNGT